MKHIAAEAFVPAYRTAEELGITEDERSRLIGFVERVECGEIKPEQFDMLRWCGTASCIGGHTGLIWAKGDWCHDYPPALESLFYPHERYDDAVPFEGAQATRNFLCGNTTNPWANIRT